MNELYCLNERMSERTKKKVFVKKINERSLFCISKYSLSRNYKTKNSNLRHQLSVTKHVSGIMLNTANFKSRLINFCSHCVYKSNIESKVLLDTHLGMVRVYIYFQSVYSTTHAIVSDPMLLYHSQKFAKLD